MIVDIKNLIIPDNVFPQTVYKSVEEIKLILDEHGQKEPIVVRPVKFEVISGFALVEAAKQLGWFNLVVSLYSERQ